MGISMITNFDMRTNLPIDTRMVADTITDRNNISELVRFIGLECFVKTGENTGPYKLVGGISNSNWTLIPYDKDVMHNKGGTFTGAVKYENSNGNIIINGDIITATTKDGNKIIIQDGDISLTKDGKEISSITEYIDNVVIRTNALRYKGEIVPKSSSPGTSTPEASVGDLYVSTSAGYINGIQVESGDWIICNEVAKAGEAKWDYIQANLSIMKGATSSAAGTSGTVPAPNVGDQGKYLKGDGKWTQLTITDVQNLQDSLNKKADLSGANFTGEVSVIDPTADGNAVNKKYVDNLTKSDKDTILKSIKELIGAENSVELESLLTLINSDYEDIDTVVAALNLLYSIIGSLDSLSVDESYKTNIVTAINNLHERVKTNTTNIGDINNAELPDEYTPENINIINLLNHISELIGNWSIIETDYGKGTDSLSEVLHDIKSDLDLITENLDDLDKNKADLSGTTFTGEVNVNTPTNNDNATNKKYVDDKDKEIKNLINTVNDTVSNIKNPIIYRDIPVDDTTGKYDVDLIRSEGWYKVTWPSNTSGLPPRIANEYFTILALPLYSGNSIMLMVFSDDTNSVNKSDISIARTYKALGYKFINGGIVTDWTRLVGIEWVIGNARPDENSESGFLTYSNGRLVGSGYDDNSFIKTPTNVDDTQLLTYDSMNKRVCNSGVEINKLVDTDVYRGYHESSISDGLVFYIDSTNLDGNGTTSAIDNNGELINLVDGHILTKYGSRNISENGFCNFGGDSSWISSDSATADGRNLMDIVFNNTSEFTIEFVYIFNDIVSSDSTNATLVKIGEGISFEKKGWYSRLLVNNYRRASGVYYKNSRTTTYNNHPTNISFINKAMHIVVTGSNVDMEYKAYVNGVEVNGGFSALATSIPDGYEGYLYGYYEDSNPLTINETYGSVKYLKIYDTILDEDEIAGKYVQEILHTSSKTFIEDKYKPALLNHLNSDMRDQIISATLTGSTLYLDRRVEMIPNLKFRVKCDSAIYLSDLSEGLTLSTTTNSGLESSYPVLWTDMENNPIEDFKLGDNDQVIFLTGAILDLEYNGVKIIIKNSYVPISDFSYQSVNAVNAGISSGTVYGICDTPALTMNKDVTITRGSITNPQIGDRLFIKFNYGITLPANDIYTAITLSIGGNSYNVRINPIDSLCYYAINHKNYITNNLSIIGFHDITEFIFDNDEDGDLCLIFIGSSTNSDISYINRIISEISLRPFKTYGSSTFNNYIYPYKNLIESINSSNGDTIFLDNFHKTTLDSTYTNLSINNINVIINGRKNATIEIDSVQLKIINSDITFKDVNIELTGTTIDTGFIYCKNSNIKFENCNITVKDLTGNTTINGVSWIDACCSIYSYDSNILFTDTNIDMNIEHTHTQCYSFISSGSGTYIEYPSKIPELTFDRCKIEINNDADNIDASTILSSDVYLIGVYSRPIVRNCEIMMSGHQYIALTSSNAHNHHVILVKEGKGIIDGNIIQMGELSSIGRDCTDFNCYHYIGTERLRLINNTIHVGSEIQISGCGHISGNSFICYGLNYSNSGTCYITIFDTPGLIITDNIFDSYTSNVDDYDIHVTVEDYYPAIIKNNKFISRNGTCSLIYQNSNSTVADNHYL